MTKQERREKSKKAIRKARLDNALASLFAIAVALFFIGLFAVIPCLIGGC